MTDRLAGNFFHSLTPESAIEWQGQVLLRVEPGAHLVEIYSALDGCRASPHKMGTNDWGRAFNDLKLGETRLEKAASPYPDMGQGARCFFVDEEERALVLPTRTVRIRSGPLVAHLETGSGRGKERSDWFITDEEVEAHMRERKPVEVRS